MVLLTVQKVPYNWTCAENNRFLHLYIRIWVQVKSFRLCDSDFGITPVDGIAIGITWAAFGFHIAHISFASSWYFFCLSVLLLLLLHSDGGKSLLWGSFCGACGTLTVYWADVYFTSLNQMNICKLFEQTFLRLRVLVQARTKLLTVYTDL